MGAVPAFKRINIRLKSFAKAKSINNTNNYFQKKKRNYLTAILKKDFLQVKKIEKTLLKRLKSKNGLIINSDLEKILITNLRKGIPLGNALLIIELQSKLMKGDKHLAHNPAFRKRAVLDVEVELTQVQYESLRLARKKALNEGLNEVAERLAIEINAKAKTLVAYKKLFQNLIE